MRRFQMFGLFILLGFASGLANASVDAVFTFNNESIQFSDNTEQCLIRMDQCHYRLNPGFPDLPVLNKHVLLPEGMHATGFTIKSMDWIELPDRAVPRPQPYPQIISAPVELKTPDISTVYHEDNFYPEHCITFHGNTIKENKTYAVLEVSPVRCNPIQERMELLRTIELVIETETTPVQTKKNRGPDDYEYLIVGPQEYELSFAPFIQWKNEKGVKTQYMQTEWIYDNFSGVDNAEKIRSAIKHEKDNNSIQYVLLAGNEAGVPVRRAVTISTSGDSKNPLVADLYYADLDGNWNANGDRTYGEVDDNVDLYTDVFIGRAWAEDAADIDTFVNKVLQYETNPPDNYVDETAFCAEVLWDEPFTDAGIHKDMVDAQCFPENWPPITKLYQTAGTETLETVLNTLNAGGHFLNHDGHAGKTAWSVGTHMVFTSEIMSLENQDKLWIVHTVGCLSNLFTGSLCMGTAFMTSPNGGAIAYMGNYSFGWGMPGSPGFGVSDLYDTKFWELLFTDETPHIGEVFARCKEYFIPQALEANVFRWVMYGLNLMGDPEMPVWTLSPVNLTVYHPRCVSPSSDKLTVWVADGDSAVPTARVCLYRPGECHSVTITDQNGYAVLTLPGNLSGPVKLTVTAHNHIPYQVDIPVDGLPDLNVGSLRIADGETTTSSGDIDGHCEPGETIDLCPVLINYGTDPATAIQGSLAIDHPHITVINNASSYPDIPGGATREPDTAFCIQVDPGCPGNIPISCELTLEYNSVSWTSRFNLMIDQEVLEVEDFYVYDMMPHGNCDGFLDPGETAYIGFDLKNSGQSCADHPSLLFKSDAAEITFMDSLVEFPSIIPDTTAPGFDRLWLSLDPNVSGRLLDLSATWQTDQCSSQELTLSIPIGQPGLFDDVESQNIPWQFEASETGWHRDNHRAWSGSYSWYCGNLTTREYDQDMDCCLTSPSFYVTDNATVSFSRWYDFPLFGEDGVRVEYLEDNEWHPIGFSGGGGALNLQSDWLTVSHVLPVKHTETQVRFRFLASDIDTAEGIYIDDISIDCDRGQPWTSAPDTDEIPPQCSDSGVKLIMPRVVYQAGDLCQLSGWICNTENISQSLDLYAVLDVYGNYYFAPSWNTTGDAISMEVSEGQSQQVILPEFTWPVIEGEASGLIFWAGLLDNSGALFGDYDYWEFGWM